jgi:hypothetical protein
MLTNPDSIINVSRHEPSNTPLDPASYAIGTQACHSR